MSKVQRKKAWHDMKPEFCSDEIPATTHCSIRGRHSLISCVSPFSFLLANRPRDPQLHIIFIILYSQPPLPPTMAFYGWNTIYYGSNREKQCLGLADKFWCKEMEQYPGHCLPGCRANNSFFRGYWRAQEGTSKGHSSQPGVCCLGCCSLC